MALFLPRSTCRIPRTAMCTFATFSTTTAATKVVLFGGLGFLGKYVTQRLVQDPTKPVQVQAVCRHPRPALEAEYQHWVKEAGLGGNEGSTIRSFASVDITDAEQVQQACQGAALIINLVGIMHESPPRYTFDSVQHQGARNVAQGAWQAGARLVHVSAIGADPHSTIPYPRTKGLGELAVRDAHPKAVIFRPSIVFGKEDDFFNRFARLARFLPVMPVFGGGHTKFQPVYVNDLAAGLCRVAWTDEYSGKIIEAGGPRALLD
ncbi:pantoate-beta-alanine ligase [Dimargaris cristalligena]|nr:pantoate-beta-alanine ligase [Dimargaris cristalligena]